MGVIFALISAGSLVIQVVDFRRIEDQLHRSVTAADNLANVRMLLSRAYLAAQRSAAGDPTFDPDEGVERVDEAVALLNDWLSGRSSLQGFRATPDPEIAELAQEYRQRMLDFRPLVSTGAPLDPVQLRMDFRALESAARAVEGRVYGMLREQLAETRSDHRRRLAVWAGLLAVAGLGLWLLARSHHRAHRDRRAAEAQSRALIQAMRDVVLVLSRDGVYVDVPGGGGELLYAPGPELIGRRVQDLLPPTEAGQIMDAVQIALDRTEPVSVDYTLVLAGRPVHFSATVSALTEDSVVVVARDVTRRHESEEALRRSEERHRMLFEANPLPMWVFDLGTWRFLMVNDAAVRHYGYTREEFLSMTIADIRPPEELPRLGAALAAQPPHAHRTTGWLHQLKDGTIIDVEIAAHRIDFGGVDAELVLINDITARVRAEAALRESTALLGAVLENSPLATITLDMARCVTRWNPAAEQLLGWCAADMVGRSIVHTVPGERLREEEDLRERVLTGVPTTIETQRRHRSGDLIDVALSAAALKDSDDTDRGYVLILLDITERKRLEAEIVQKRKMEAIGSLAGGIAHDFNNLLTVINSYASFLVDALSGQAMAADAAEIRKAGERAAELTHQLLAFSRRQVLQPGPVPLNDIILDMQRMLQRLIGENIRFDTRLQPELPAVHADRTQIEQVILNLVVNARDAMPGGGRLLVETSVLRSEGRVAKLVPGEYVVMRVTDEGVGMNAAIIDRIFEPYFTTKRLGEGTGLGLATVYGIIEQSGGSIAVSSEVGHGTAFEVFLPPHTSSETTTAPREGEPPGSDIEGRTVLLVEDDDAVRRIARRTLQARGADVLEASSAEIALELLAQRGSGPDVLITDMVMPGMSGRSLASTVAEHYPATSILIMSGYTEESLSEAGSLPRAASYLEKPFTPASLLRAVGQALT